jgi:hypothetical protein
MGGNVQHFLNEIQSPTFFKGDTKYGKLKRKRNKHF